MCSNPGDFPLPVMACGVVGAASWAICVLASIHLPSGPCWLLSLLCLACLGVWHPLYSVVLACRLAFGAPFGPKATVGHVVRLTNMEEILAARDLRGFLDNRQQEPQSISVLRRRDGSRPGIAHIRFSNVTDAAKVAGFDWSKVQRDPLGVSIITAREADEEERKEAANNKRTAIDDMVQSGREKADRLGVDAPRS